MFGEIVFVRVIQAVAEESDVCVDAIVSVESGVEESRDDSDGLDEDRTVTVAADVTDGERVLKNDSLARAVGDVRAVRDTSADTDGEGVYVSLIPVDEGVPVSEKNAVNEDFGVKL